MGKKRVIYFRTILNGDSEPFFSKIVEEDIAYLIRDHFLEVIGNAGGSCRDISIEIQEIV